MNDTVRMSVGEVIRKKNDGDARSALLVALMHLEANHLPEAEMGAINASHILGGMSKRNILHSAITLRGNLREYIDGLRDEGSSECRRAIADDLEAILKKMEIEDGTVD